MTDYTTREYIIRETTYPDATKQELIGELVRCRDCKYSHMTVNGECKYCDIWFPDEAEYTDGDYYCASGERKDGEANENH